MINMYLTRPWDSCSSFAFFFHIFFFSFRHQQAHQMFVALCPPKASSVLHVFPLVLLLPFPLLFFSLFLCFKGSWVLFLAVYLASTDVLTFTAFFQGPWVLSLAVAFLGTGVPSLAVLFKGYWVLSLAVFLFHQEHSVHEEDQAPNHSLVQLDSPHLARVTPTADWLCLALDHFHCLSRGNSHLKGSPASFHLLTIHTNTVGKHDD